MWPSSSFATELSYGGALYLAVIKARALWLTLVACGTHADWALLAAGLSWTGILVGFFTLFVISTTRTSTREPARFVGAAGLSSFYGGIALIGFGDVYDYPPAMSVGMICFVVGIALGLAGFSIAAWTSPTPPEA